MATFDVDRLARRRGSRSTRRAAVALAGAILAGLGLTPEDGAAGCKKKNEIRCGRNQKELKDARGCWHCCADNTDIACPKGNCCRSAVAHCCANSSVCRANVTPGCPD